MSSQDENAAIDRLQNTLNRAREHNEVQAIVRTQDLSLILSLPRKEEIFVGLYNAAIEQDVTEIDYINWRGKRAKRKIRPVALLVGKTKWHPERQLLLKAFDFGKDEVRLFAVRDILGIARVEAEIPQ